MKNATPHSHLQQLRTPDFVRLFWYVKKISVLIGSNKALKLLEDYVLLKRLSWLKENHIAIKKVKGSPVERACKIFYEMNQGLNFEDAVIVKKSAKSMTSRWTNYCPVLEACKLSGFDTRKICKRIYDRPNQIFLSKLNPGLRFKRNYNAIRPHAPYCEETIQLENVTTK